MTEQDHTTLPTNLREAADDLPRFETSEEHWRFRNLMTWAADRIEKLEADEAASFTHKVALIDAVRAIQTDEATDEALAGENETVSQTAARLLRVAHERGAFAPNTAPAKPSYYSRTPVDLDDACSLQWHGTAEKAKREAESVLEDGSNGWPEDIAAVEWGMLMPFERAVEHNRQETPEGEFDWTCEYKLAPVTPPAPSFTNNGTRVTFFADGEDSPCSELTLCLGKMIEADPEEGIEAGQDFTLRCDGELHDGLSSLEEVERTFPMVAATLEDWKADRLVPFAVVLEEARRLYRSEAAGATAQRIAELEHLLFSEQGSNANDRFELTEEIKRLTAASQSLRTAGEHSEVKFMAAAERTRALEVLLAEIVDEAPEALSLDIQARISEIPEGVDQREADIALSREVEEQALTRLVVEAGALLFCGERDPVAIAGKALIGMFRALDREDLLDEDMDDALPGFIADLAERLDPDDIDGDDGE